MTTHNMKDYEETYSSFNWERPEKYNFARDVVDRWANEEPSLQAMLWIDDEGNEIQRTFSDFAVASRKLCNVLSDAGVGRGDVVIVMLSRQIQWWEVFTAVLRMGAIISPGTTQLSSKDLEYRINAAGATCIVTDSGNAAKVDEVHAACPSLKARIMIDGTRDGWIDYSEAMASASGKFETVDTGSDEECMCYFTSGTTGFPKLCIHSHSYGLGQQTTGKFWLDLRKDDLHWNISDTGWAKAAWSSYFGPWNCGATLFVHHTGGFNAQRTLELLEKYPITTMCGAPTIYRMLVLEDLAKYNFNTLRHSVGAGEPLNPEIIEIWRKATGITIRDGYGQTETVILCGSFPCLEPRFGSMGKAAPGIELEVIDNDGKVVEANTEGDIAVRVVPERPLGLFKEYRDNPEKNSGDLQGRLVPDRRPCPQGRRWIFLVCQPCR